MKAPSPLLLFLFLLAHAVQEKQRFSPTLPAKQKEKAGLPRRFPAQGACLKKYTHTQFAQPST